MRKIAARVCTCVVLLACLVVAMPAAMAAPAATLRMLFVGNSFTYVANVPAVFEALASSAGRAVQADYIVRGGATLAQRVDDGSVARALQSGQYDVLVLQELGGALACGASDEPACDDAERGLRALVALAGELQVRPLLLGTYLCETRPTAFVASETAAAERVGAVYVDVASALVAGQAALPALDWCSDWMHGGRDLAMLQALLLHVRMFGELPPAGEVMVSAPMFEASARFEAAVRPAASVEGMPGFGHVYAADVVEEAGRGVAVVPGPSAVVCGRVVGKRSRMNPLRQGWRERSSCRGRFSGDRAGAEVIADLSGGCRR